jgi:hypothetical protein
MSPGRDRQGAITALAETFREGRTLTIPDIGRIIMDFGYSEQTARDVIGNVRVVRALGEQGIELTTEMYRRTKIFRDGQLPIDQTDLEATKQRVDQLEEERISKIRTSSR